MAHKILKYQLVGVDSDIELQLPTGARVLHCKFSNSKGNPLMLWALVDTTLPEVTRYFRVCKTGSVIDDPEDWVHIGSVDSPQESTVHVFERVL